MTEKVQEWTNRDAAGQPRTTLEQRSEFLDLRIVEHGKLSPLKFSDLTSHKITTDVE